jgi:hypothetical protein
MSVSSKELDNLVEAKLLKAEPSDQAEFDGLFRSGVARLADSKIAGLSIDSRFSLAYDAAHSFALAAMRWHGYRPSNKRFVVFQALQHTLGIPRRKSGECSTIVTANEIWRIIKAHLKSMLSFSKNLSRLPKPFRHWSENLGQSGIK